MKLLLVLLFLGSGSAFAKSRVGEWAAYDYQESNSLISIKGALLREITDQKRMSSPQGKQQIYLEISETFTTNKETKQSKRWIPESDYMTSFDLNVLIFNCRFNEKVGTIENVKVKAGKFSSCRQKDQDSWIGVVPFHHILYISY